MPRSATYTRPLEAAAGGSREILQSLVKRGLDLNRRDDYGWTPLHYAARDGRVECARWLARSKAKLNARTIAGQTPFNIAREREMASLAELLQELGGDTGPIRFPTLGGPYLGQEPPGDEPQRFATGIVSSIRGLRSSISFSPDGDLALWSPMVYVPGEVYSRG